MDKFKTRDRVRITEDAEQPAPWFIRGERAILLRRIDTALWLAYVEDQGRFALPSSVFVKEPAPDGT